MSFRALLWQSFDGYGEKSALGAEELQKTLIWHCATTTEALDPVNSLIKKLTTWRGFSELGFECLRDWETYEDSQAKKIIQEISVG